MSTHDFFRVARYLDYDRSWMMNHSVAFTQVGDNGFDVSGETALELALGGAKASQYNLDSETEVSVLAQTIAAQSYKLTFINVKSSVSNDKLNLISSSLQDAVKAAGVSNYVMGIVGVKVDGKLSLQ